MDFLDDPEEMTAEERLGEVASILAIGCLRLRSRSTPLAGGTDVATASTEKPLDCSDPPNPPLDKRLATRESALQEVSK